MEDKPESHYQIHDIEINWQEIKIDNGDQENDLCHAIGISNGTTY